MSLDELVKFRCEALTKKNTRCRRTANSVVFGGTTRTRERLTINYRGCCDQHWEYTPKGWW